MSTLSIQLRYRPVRIGWCVERGDIEAYRESARRSFSLWGGRFNPIIPIDDPQHAGRLIDLFRTDCLYPGSDTDAVKNFIEQQRHLPWPGHHRRFVLDWGATGKTSAFADLITPVRQLFDAHFKNNPQAENLLVLHDWSDDDPLKDVLLATFGSLPEPSHTAEDYRGLLQAQLRAEVHKIAPDQVLALPDLGKMSLATLNAWNMKPHYSVRFGWRYPGFFLGDASDFDDLIAYWNLRATGNQLVFFDRTFADRLKHLKDQWLGRLPELLGSDPRPRTAIWSRADVPADQVATFGENPTICRVGPNLWNGLNVKAPIMYFGGDDVLS